MAGITPRDIPPNDMTIPELEKWLSRYSENIFPYPQVNFGGAVKRQQALRDCLKVCYKLQNGSIEELIKILKKRTGLTSRKIKEDYINELIEANIIDSSLSEWTYIGKKPEKGEKP